MSFSVREAQTSDAECVLDMVKELCEYQGSSLSEVKNTAQALIDDGIKNGNFFKCLIAEVEPSGGAEKPGIKETVGYALYFYGYSSWQGKLLYLEDIYVRPAHRGKGIGIGIFKRLGEIAVETKCCRIAFMCLNSNLPAKDFYQKIGSEEQSEWRHFHLKSNGIENLLTKF